MTPQLAFSRYDLDMELFNQFVEMAPIVPGKKVPVKDFPLSKYYRGEAETTYEDLEYYRQKGYDRAAIVGPNSDCLIVLDFDSMEAAKKFWDQKLFDSLPQETLTNRTSRGIQYWFKDRTLNFEQLRSSIDARPVLDAEILLHHHLAQCPMNSHPSGAIYQLLGTPKIQVRPGVFNQLVERFRSLGFNGEIYRSNFDSGPAVERVLDGKVSEEEKEKLARYLSQLWRPGYRNYVGLSLAGYLIKKKVCERDALEIQERICEIAGDRSQFSALSRIRYQYRYRSNKPNLLGIKGIAEVKASLGVA